jgi:hypothetical protein
MDPVGYLTAGFIVYLSTALGIYLAKAYREEVDQYERLIGWLIQVVFVGVWTAVAWAITGDILISGVLFASAVLGSIFIKLTKHIVFTILSAAYILAVVFSTEPLAPIALLFVFGALTTMLAAREKSAKRIMIRRLPFFILVLFGYLVSFLV